MFNKKKNKETDPVKEKQKIVNESIKNAKKEKKKTKKKQPRITTNTHLYVRFQGSSTIRLVQGRSIPI